MRSEILPDGTITKWHENGKVALFNKEVALEGDKIPRKILIYCDESGKLEEIHSKDFDGAIIDTNDSGYYTCQDKKILKELLDKLGIEMPDNITFKC